MEGLTVAGIGGTEPSIDDGTRLWTTTEGTTEASGWGNANVEGGRVSVSRSGSAVGAVVTGRAADLFIQHRRGLYSSSQQPFLFRPSPFKQQPAHTKTSSKHDASLAQRISLGAVVCTEGVSVGAVVSRFDKLGR